MISSDNDLVELWHLSYKIFSLGKKRMEESLAKITLKPIEARILFILGCDNEVPMGRMAEIINVTPAWITGTLDEMERKGYITKIRSLNDRRIVNVKLTGEGTIKLSEGRKLYGEFISGALKPLSEDERKTFREILEKMESVLS